MKKTVLLVTLALLAIAIRGQTNSAPAQALGPKRFGPMRGHGLIRRPFGPETDERLKMAVEHRERNWFNQRYPTGRNEYGRTYDEQQQFISDYKIDEFFGEKFGSELASEQHRKLAKPFRLLTDMTLLPTEKHRLWKIIVDRETDDISQEDLKAETLKLAALFELFYGFEITGHPCSSTESEECECYEFINAKVKITVENAYEFKTGKGWIGVTALKPDIHRVDKEAARKERLNAIKAKQRKTNIPLTEGLELLPKPYTNNIPEAVQALAAELEKDPSASLDRLRSIGVKIINSKQDD